jgi:hypothetical protein
MTLTNNSTEAREVEISFKFGYPSTDSTGKTVMVYDDSEAEEKYSLKPHLKAFPRKMIIQPKKEQAVRFLAMLPPELEDGTYWTRVSILSKPIDKQIDTNTTEDEIRAGFVVNTELVNLVIFQKGKQTTGVELKDLNTEITDSLVTIDFEAERKGNCPFWGNFHMIMTDETKDEVLFDSQKPVAVYFDSYQKLVFNKANFEPGNYKIELRVNNEREDIPDENKIKFEANKLEKEFTIN